MTVIANGMDEEIQGLGDKFDRKVNLSILDFLPLELRSQLWMLCDSPRDQHEIDRIKPDLLSNYRPCVSQPISSCSLNRSSTPTEESSAVMNFKTSALTAATYNKSQFGDHLKPIECPKLIE